MKQSVHRWAAGTVAALVLLTSGCAASGSGSSSGGGKKQITVGAIYLDTQGFYAGVRKGINDGAAAAGQKVRVVESNAQDDASKESQFVSTLVSSHADAILMSAASGQGSVPAIRMATKADIPVICYNTCVNPASTKKYVSAYAYGDPTEFGHKVGLAAADYFTKAGITAPKIGVVNCEFVEVCVARRKGFEAALKEKVPGYTLVANQQGTDPSKSIGVAEDIITAHPDIDAFFGESGGATIGAVKAVQNRGRVGKTVVFGSDMTTELATALKDGSVLKGEVDVSGQAVGRAAIKAAIATINGKKPKNVDVAVPIDLYTTPAQASDWLTAHPDGIP